MIGILFFLQTPLLQRKMCPNKDRRVKKIEVSTDTPTQRLTCGTRRQIYRQGKEGRGKEAAGGSQNEARKKETTRSAVERVAEKSARTDRSDTKIDTEAGGEVTTSQSHSRHKKGHMTNIYLTDSDE